MVSGGESELLAWSAISILPDVDCFFGEKPGQNFRKSRKGGGGNKFHVRSFKFASDRYMKGKFKLTS
jgi:hypothetical protein